MKKSSVIVLLSVLIISVITVILLAFDKPDVTIEIDEETSYVTTTSTTTSESLEELVDPNITEVVITEPTTTSTTLTTITTLTTTKSSTTKTTTTKRSNQIETTTTKNISTTSAVASTSAATTTTTSTTTTTKSTTTTTKEVKPSTITEEYAYQKMIALKSSYPEGMRFENTMEFSKTYILYILYPASDNKGTNPIYTRYTTIGCAYFTMILSGAVFGDDAMLKKHYDVNNLKVGDIVRINNDTHSVIILARTNDYYMVAEGNYNKTVHWGRIISKTDMANNFTYAFTRY